MKVSRRPILLFGGSGVERLVSVATAQHVSQALPGARHWFLDPEGTVHEVTQQQLAAHQNAFTVQMSAKGVPHWPSLRAALEDIRPEEHCAFIALHGEDGESGELQVLLDRRGVAYTGSDSRASALAYDKARAKQLARSVGVRTAEATGFKRSEAHWEQRLTALFSQWGAIVIKPQEGGSSVGLHILRAAADLDRYLTTSESTDDQLLLVEQFITGREFTVGVIERNDAPCALPLSEVITATHRTFDYAGKYLNSGTTEITPAEVGASEAQLLTEAALLIHTSVGCRGYSRSDFILSGNGPIFLEVNTLPGLTRQSFIPQQLRAAGISFTDFIEEQLKIARSG